MNNDAVRELLNAVGALAEMSLNFYRALLNAGATKEEAFALTTLCVKDGDKSYEGQSVGETLRMLPLELADREIDKSWWFFNTFVITLK